MSKIPLLSCFMRYIDMNTLQKLPVLSTSHWCEWTHTVANEIYLRCIEHIDDCIPCSCTWLTFKANMIQVNNVSMYIMVGSRLSPIVCQLSNKLYHRAIVIRVKEDACTKCVMSFLNKAAEVEPIAIRIRNAPSCVVSAILRANICSYLEFEQSDLQRTSFSFCAIANASNLRIISFGYCPEGIPTLLREACFRNHHIVYAGAYTGSPANSINLPNRLVPHPGCWMFKSMLPLDSNILDYHLPDGVIDEISKATGIEFYRQAHSERPLFQTALLVNDANARNTAMMRTDPLFDKCLDNHSFHGTSITNIPAIQQQGLISHNDYIFTTPDPMYACHPSFAIPFIVQEGVAVQFIVEVESNDAPVAKLPASVNCHFDHPTIEWKYSNNFHHVVKYIWAVVYARH